MVFAVVPVVVDVRVVNFVVGFVKVIVGFVVVVVFADVPVVVDVKVEVDVHDVAVLRVVLRVS